MNVAAARDCYCEGDWLCHHHLPAEMRIAVHIAVRDIAARLAAAEKRAAEFEALYDNCLRESAKLVPRTQSHPSASDPLALVEEMERLHHEVQRTQRLVDRLGHLMGFEERRDADRKRKDSLVALQNFCVEHTPALCAAVREAREENDRLRKIEAIVTIERGRDGTWSEGGWLAVGQALIQREAATKSWRRLAMEAMRYLNAEQIAAVTKATGFQANICTDESIAVARTPGAPSR